jgi:uncharacterized protein (DUF433 family)
MRSFMPRPKRLSAALSCRAMLPSMEAAMIDWSQCPDVERVPGRVSGQWVVKDTRILAQGVIDNAEDFTPEEIASEIDEVLGADRARRIIEYARRHATHPHPA